MKKITIILFACMLLLFGCEFVTKEPTQSGKCNMLLVGQNYKKQDIIRIKTLSGCIPDAISLHLALKQCASDTGMTMGSDILLTDTLADLKVSDMEGAIQTIASSATDDDLTIIYYSGHGTSEGALVFPDETGVKSYKTLLPADLLSKANTIAGRKLIILDSCYSGAIIDTYGLTCTEGIPASIFDAYFKDASYGLNDLFLLTASTSKTKSLEFNSLGHGIFTYCLLTCLGWKSDTSIGKPTIIKDGYVTLDSLRENTVNKVKAYTSSQTATINGTADNLVLFDYR